jgi:hypothetical protein
MKARIKMAEINIEKMAQNVAERAIQELRDNGVFIGRWIPVKDNLPMMGQDVLICDYDGDMYISYLHTDGKWGYDYVGNKLKNIIAWMPLPESYKTEKEGEE